MKNKVTEEHSPAELWAKEWLRSSGLKTPEGDAILIVNSFIRWQGESLPESAGDTCFECQWWADGLPDDLVKFFKDKNDHIEWLMNRGWLKYSYYDLEPYNSFKANCGHEPELRRCKADRPKCSYFISLSSVECGERTQRSARFAVLWEAKRGRMQDKREEIITESLKGAMKEPPRPILSPCRMIKEGDETGGRVKEGQTGEPEPPENIRRYEGDTGIKEFFKRLLRGPPNGLDNRG